MSDQVTGIGRGGVVAGDEDRDLVEATLGQAWHPLGPVVQHVAIRECPPHVPGVADGRLVPVGWCAVTDEAGVQVVHDDL
ncbi:MAG: hypothetical protein FJ026_03960 [Chloroflexi bacterium]|nr:hypothetical protein [Chloroflexota bacterium]